MIRASRLLRVVENSVPLAPYEREVRNGRAGRIRLESEPVLACRPRDEPFGLATSEVGIRSVVDGQRLTVLRPPDAVGNSCVDRLPVAECIVEVEVVE